MRLEMRRRFMLLYKHYRFKKYGEPVDAKGTAAAGYNFDLAEVEDYDKEDAAFLAKIKLMVKAEPIDYDRIGLKKQDSHVN